MTLTPPQASPGAPAPRQAPEAPDTSPYPRGVNAPAPAEPTSRLGHFNAGMSAGMNTSPGFHGNSVLNQYVWSANASAAGPSGADRRLIGMTPGGPEEMGAPNGMSSSSYTARTQSFKMNLMQP
jgi:hypothetical protein